MYPPPHRHAKAKVELGAKLAFNELRQDALPTFQHIFAGGQLEKALHQNAQDCGGAGGAVTGGGGGKGDTLVMITAPHGKSTDLRRWLRPPRVHASSSTPPPKDTSRVVSQLGRWRECAVDVGAESTCDFEEAGSTFFYHTVTHKRSWTFEPWCV